MQYTVVYEQTPRNWGAYVPDLPGCVAVAKTRKGTERLIRGAIEMYLEACVEYNEPIPQPGAWTGTVEVEVPSAETVKQRVAEDAERLARKRLTRGLGHRRGGEAEIG